jgi:hypothetical protein
MVENDNKRDARTGLPACLVSESRPIQIDDKLFCCSSGTFPRSVGLSRSSESCLESRLAQQGMRVRTLPSTEFLSTVFDLRCYNNATATAMLATIRASWGGCSHSTMPTITLSNCVSN